MTSLPAPAPRYGRAPVVPRAWPWQATDRDYADRAVAAANVAAAVERARKSLAKRA